MALQLKTSGLATELIACVAVDDDGTTIKDFVTANTGAPDVGMSVGTSSWKGTTYPYFEPEANGSFAFFGYRWSGTKPAIDFPGDWSFFFAVAEFINDNGGVVSIGAGIYGLGLNGSNQPVFHASSGDRFTGSTAWATATKFSSAGAWVNNSASTAFYHGLESGSAALDNSGNPGNFGGAAQRTLDAIGGRAGSGYCNARFHVACFFNRELTLTEVQSLHDDWFGTLFETAGGGGALTGTSAATSGATGTLKGTGALTGTSAATSGATGTLASAGTLAGTSAATSGATGTLKGTGALSGTSAATSGATGTLTGIAAGAMSGTSAATSGATGTLRGTGALSGTITVTSGATGSFVAANTNTGGDGFTKAELRRLRAKAKKAREREERRRGEKVAADDRLIDELAAIYDRATGAAPAHVAAVAEVVQPFAETKAAIPPAASVDWQALARDREALNALRREIRAMEQEEEDLQILMLAA